MLWEWEDGGYRGGRGGGEERVGNKRLRGGDMMIGRDLMGRDDVRGVDSVGLCHVDLRVVVVV
jgi:hypothetical protein